MGIETQQTVLRLGSIMATVTRDPIEVVARSGLVDAIVSSDDAQLSMSGGASAAIAQAAGDRMREETAQIGPLRVGEIGVTSGGDLPIKYILHVVTLTGWEPTERTVRQIARDIFVRCEALGIHRVAIPAFATAAAGFSIAVLTGLVTEVLLEHALSSTNLTRIVFPVPDEDAYRAVLEELSREGSLGVDSKWNLLETKGAAMGGKAVKETDQDEAEDRDVRGVDVPSGPPGVSKAIDLDPAGPTEEYHRVLQAPEAVRDSRAVLGGRYVVLEKVGSGGLGAVFHAWDLVRQRSVAIKIAPGGTIAAETPAAMPGEVRRRGLVARIFGARGRRNRPGEINRKSAKGAVGERRAVCEDTETAPNSRAVIGERYVLLEELGRGGMAVVFFAWDLVLRQSVAIKVLRKEFINTDLLRHEAAMATNLSHDGILRVYHFEPAQGGSSPYMVMEHVPWASGEKWIAAAGQSFLPVRAMFEVGIYLCDALAYAHSKGVLHGDIKPSNIFIDPAGERAKLADFGLARAATGMGKNIMQLHSSGTPAYMAPEQMRPGSRLNTSTDIYQLSATLWDLLTGLPPRMQFDHPRAIEAERKSALQAIGPGLAEDPKARPQRVEDFAELLRAELRRTSEVANP